MATVAEKILLASAAYTASTQSVAYPTTEINRSYTGDEGIQLGASFLLDCTTSSGTSPTLAVAVQGQGVAGSWKTLPGCVFGTITSSVAVAGNDVIPYPYPLPPNLRAVATIGGTSPSFTFAVKAHIIG